MSVKYFKCFIMQETKNMKLNAVEYALLMWILNWCLMYDNCNLTYKEIEERLPFIIKRCQFDRAINTLAELGFIVKDSDKKNVVYHICEEKFHELYDISEQYQTFIEKNKPANENHHENHQQVTSGIEDRCKLSSGVIITNTTNNVNNSNSLTYSDPNELYNLPAEQVPIKKKRKVFVIPTVEEIADHMYNFLVSERGVKQVNSKMVKTEAECFFFFYNSKEWKVGKSPMKNWRAAASGWIVRSNKNFELQTQTDYESLERFQRIANPDGFHFMKHEWDK